MRRLWMRSSYVSHVLEPSPHCACVSQRSANKARKDNDICRPLLCINLRASCELWEELTSQHKHPSGTRPTTSRIARTGDLQVLGRQTDGSLDEQLLAMGALDQLAAHLLEGLHLSRGESDALRPRERVSMRYFMATASIEEPRTILWFLAASRPSFSPLFILAVG